MGPETFLQMIARHRREILAHLRASNGDVHSVFVGLDIQPDIWPGKSGDRIEIRGRVDRHALDGAK